MSKQKLTGERIVNLGLLLVSAFYLYYTLTNYKMGTVRLPKEGFMPTLLGIGMVCVSGFLTVQSFLGRGDASHVKIDIEWWRFAAIIASSVLYALTLNILGYLLGTFLFLLVLLKLAQVDGLVKRLLISVLSAVAFYVIFKVALGVMLPAGFVGL
jgi:putative tricarboxylic transport membrane protein